MKLSDDQYLQFLTDGYLVIQPESLPDEYHDSIWQKADGLYDWTSRLKSPTSHLSILGDNVRAQIPEIDHVLADPAVTGAVSSILGEDAFLHPHHFLHESSKRDQPFHQDGNLPWNERGHYRAHRPDWLILFYYPQAVTLENGPTEIIPSSQYWTTDIENEDGTWRPGDPIDPDLGFDVLAGDDLDIRDQRLSASVEKLHIPGIERKFIQLPKGSVALVHYDLIHRGTRKLPEAAARYMFKFYYARTREPALAAWSNQEVLPDLGNVRPDLQPVARSIWAWSRGERRRQATEPAQLEAAADQLLTGRENEKVAAAYVLGSDSGNFSLQTLLEGLYHRDEGTRRASAYGLRLRCDEAGEALTEASQHERVSVRRFAAFALGAAWSPGTDALLSMLQSESDDLARSNAAYAVGQAARNPDIDGHRILEALLDRLGPGVEPDNTDIAGLSRSTVRQSIAYAVLQLASNHTLDADEKSKISALATREPDRYVAGMLYEAIALHSEDCEALRALSARRWNDVGNTSANTLPRF